METRINFINTALFIMAITGKPEELFTRFDASLYSEHFWLQ